MSDKFRVVYYLNQFFGQIGGEDKADIAPFLEEKAIGPAGAFDKMLENGEVVGTVICGDNYFNEKDTATDEVLKMIEDLNPDFVVTGPAFNAGRYGMACAEVAKEVSERLKIPTVSGMYIENPGVDVCKKTTYVVETPDSAAGMRKSLPKIANIVNKLANNEEIGTPEEDGYIPQGRRKSVFHEKRGSLRAVEMLIARLNGEEFETELPMPTFDNVEPADPIKNIKKAKIALITSGGIVPIDNPDRIESASATKYGSYSIEGMERLSANEFKTIHGGYDPVYANEDPNRVVPLDAARELEKEGEVGSVHNKYYITTGTGTSVANAKQFGEDIAKELLQAGVDGVLLTST